MCPDEGKYNKCELAKSETHGIKIPLLEKRRFGGDCVGCWSLLVHTEHIIIAAAMNYAEDRLDRRARADEAGATVAEEITTDLEKAHDVFKIHGTFTVAASTDSVDSFLQLIDAHELAGRTLRDCGQIRQSVFHFGMAWKICHWLEKQHHNDNINETSNEWKAVGDYAQICEIGGFPEIGILALLYYRCRGSLDPYNAIVEESCQVESTGCGCGCGMAILKLSCMSIPYLSTLLPPSSKEGKRMAKEYKSHNAYLVFIRSLVLGERIKKHRVGKVIHHTPIWDTVFGLLHESEEDALTCQSDAQKGKSLSHYFKEVIRDCSNKSSHILPQSISPHPPIYVVGDSHVLSLAWQTLRINDINSGTYKQRTATPFPATGVKAFHLRSSTQFFTHYNLHALLRRLPNQDLTRTIILSAGEIDCREGIGGTLLKGYYSSCNDAVEDTVRKYLSAASTIALKYNLQVLIMPVAPHAYRSIKNGKSVGRAKRRETMYLWNKVLRSELQASKWTNVFLLDYEESLQYQDHTSPVGYSLNPCYNADYTHTNNAIVPLVAEAIQNSGCDLNFL
eukprot:scaffold3049_cov122-Skeletonema_dohrnii-CCMP3373.AAC.10